MATVDPTDPSLLRVTFEEGCIVINDQEEYLYNSADEIKTVALLCAFLERQV
jgi:hypothetical protein